MSAPVSLKVRLFLRVAPVIVIVIAAVGIFAFNSTKREIKYVYDAQMISNANTLWTIVADEAQEAEKEGAKEIGDIDFTVGNQLAINDYADDYADAHMFRVWQNGKIVVSSHNAIPAAVPRRKKGFTQVAYNGDLWRVYAFPLPDGKFAIEVGEKMALRRAIVNNILLDLVVPLAILIPAVMLLIWLGINNGLGQLRRLVAQIGTRSADDLSPVGSGNMPRDIAPVFESVNQLMDRLSHSFAAEKRFLDDAAHHLRTPLTALKLQLQMLGKASDPAERQALLGELLRSSDRASKVVGQLLTSARLGHEPVEMKPVELRAAISAAMTGLSALAAQKNIELSLDGPEDALVKADEAVLRLMLENLIENAIKYSPQDGKVAVSIAPAASGWKVAILDSGPGIPDGHRQLVFQRFYRLNRAPADGSGLGLAIVAEAIKKLSGRITLNSPAAGTGLLAEVTLPGA